jgi:zinc ribbon protein
MNETQLSCASCGAANPPDAQFCRECGAILVRGGSAPRQPPLVPGERPTTPPAGAGTPPQNKQDPKAWIALVVAILILGGIAAYFIRNRGSSEIPVSGEAPAGTPTAAATEAPTIAPEPTSPRPTRAPEATRSRPTLAPESTPRDFHEPPIVPTPRAAREPEPYPTAPAPRNPPRSESPRRETEPAIEGSVTQRAGWYRVKFRAPLFAQPSETSSVVTYLRPGTRIRVTHAVPGFLAVESTTGKAPGWVSTDDAVPEGIDAR